MKKSRFTDSQIVSVLRKADAGMKVTDICCKHGISDATYYNRKAKGVSDLNRMKEMEARTLPAQAYVCRPGAGEPGDEGTHRKKLLGRRTNAKQPDICTTPTSS